METEQSVERSVLLNSRVSEILSGRRSMSKAQAKQLAGFFGVPYAAGLSPSSRFTRSVRSFSLRRVSAWKRSCFSDQSARRVT